MVLGASTVGKMIGQRLHAVERAVAADADQPLDLQPLQAIGDLARSCPDRRGST